MQWLLNEYVFMSLLKGKIQLSKFEDIVNFI